MLTLPVLLTVSSVLLAMELTGADNAPAAQGAFISPASSEAAGAAVEPEPPAPTVVPPAVAEPAEAGETGKKQNGKKKQKKKNEKNGALAALPEVEGTVVISAVGDIVMGTPTLGFPPEGGKTFFAGVESLLDGDIVLGQPRGHAFEWWRFALQRRRAELLLVPDATVLRALAEPCRLYDPQPG